MSATKAIPPTATTPKQKADFVNGQVQAQIDQQYNNITKGSTFDAGEVSQYFVISDIAQLPLVSKVLAPLAAAGTKMDEPSLVLNAGLAAMKAGTLSSSEFSSGVEQLYRKASMTNIAFRDLKGFGIKLPPGDLAYKTKIGRWGDPVNLLDSTQLNRWIIQTTMTEKVVNDFSNFDPVKLGTEFGASRQLQYGPKNSAFPDPTKPARSPYVNK